VKTSILSNDYLALNEQIMKNIQYNKNLFNFQNQINTYDEKQIQDNNHLNFIKENGEKRTKRTKRSSFDFTAKNKPHRIFIESHRGVNKEEPENTLAAFEKAIYLECDSIELDIWLTKDKIPIVLHGNEEGRINENSGMINNYIYSEISLIKLDKNYNIPRLEDVFRLCKNKIFLNLEIKDTNFKDAFYEVYRLINDYNMHNEIAISSFHHEYYEEIKMKNLHLTIEFGLLYDISEHRKNEVHFNFMNSTINLYFRDINQEIVKKAHEKNIGILAWFKMTDDETEEIIINLIKLKVDIICTNDPRKILKFINTLEFAN